MASAKINPAEEENEDIFHDVVMLEESFQKEGYRQGFEIGERTGFDEGYKLGREKGASIGSEIGFYQGFSAAWLTILDGPDVKPRKIKAVKALVSMIADFPLEDVTNPQMFEELENIRAKFKQVTSLLGVTADLGTPATLSF